MCRANPRLLCGATLVMAAMIIFGVFGYISLPIAALPNFDFPTITVSASLPGAGLDRLACRPRAQSRPGTYAGVPLSRGRWPPGAGDPGGVRLWWWRLNVRAGWRCGPFPPAGGWSLRP